MKHITLSLVILLLFKVSSASHIKGGYITAQKNFWNECYIFLHVFTDPASFADPNTASVIIDFGDGKQETVQRDSRFTIGTGMVENIYTTLHHYASSGIYAISYSDQNMIDGIQNVNFGNSSNSTFYVETYISVEPDPLMSTFVQFRPWCFNSEVSVVKGNTLYYNPSVYSYSSNLHDSMSFELITPLVTNYVMPNNISIDAYTGTIKWSNTNISFSGQSAYVMINYKVNFFRKNIKLNHYTVCQLIKVLNTQSFNYPVPNLPGTSLTSSEWYKKPIPAFGQYTQEISYTKDPNNPVITTFSGNFIYTVADSSTSGLSRFIVNYSIDSNFTPIRNWPYFLIIRDSFTNSKTTRDYVLAIYFGASLNLSIKDLKVTNKEANVFPNPFKNICTFMVNDNNELHNIFITDINGKNLYSGEFKGNEFLFDASSLRPGNYFYLIKNEEGKLVKGKLILTE